MCYSIGEVSDMLGVAPSTLRYYDKEGMLPFIKRTSGGVREFRKEDLEWLRIIECLKKTNMSIKEIKQFIDWCMVLRNRQSRRYDGYSQQELNVKTFARRRKRDGGIQAQFRLKPVFIVNITRHCRPCVA